MTDSTDRSGQVAILAFKRGSAGHQCRVQSLQLSLLLGLAMLFVCGYVLSSTFLLFPFCVSFALTAVLTTLLARFLAEQGTIKRLLFPRTTTELAGALRWPTLGAHGAIAASKPDTRNHDR